MSAWIETQRGSVESWDADYLGHMNVQFYIGRFSDAALGCCAALGLTPAAIREERRGLATVRQRVKFLQELRPGDFQHIESAISALGGKSLTMIHRMINSATGEVAATMEQTGVLFDLEARRGLVWPDAMRARALPLKVDWREAPPVFPPVPEGLDGFRDTYRGAANPWEVDTMGHFSVQFYIARFSAAAGQALLNVGLSREAQEENSLGLAALDYLLNYRRECRAGDCLVIKTGITEVGNKTLKLCHKMLDAISGEQVATLEVVSLLFNTARRRGEPLPAEMRARAEALLVSGGVSR